MENYEPPSVVLMDINIWTVDKDEFCFASMGVIYKYRKQIKETLKKLKNYIQRILLYRHPHILSLKIFSCYFPLKRLEFYSAGEWGGILLHIMLWNFFKVILSLKSE